MSRRSARKPGDRPGTGVQPTRHWLRCGGHRGSDAGACPIPPRPPACFLRAAAADITGAQRPAETNMQHHSLTLALATLFASPAAFAQSGPTELDEVVVTATRTPIALVDSIAPVQVIDREAIERDRKSVV